MKLSQLKEEIKGIIRERGVAAIQKEYQKTIEEIEKALDFYKKNKNTDKKDAFVKVLKQLGEKKKALQNELDLKVQSMYRNAELKADESVNEDANPKFFPSGKKEWAKSATFFDADKVDILLITSKYKDVNDAYYIFKKDGRFIGSADSIKGGNPSGTKVNVKLSDVSNAKSIGDLKKMIGESVNEAKYPTDLKIGSVIKGQGFTRLKGIDGGKYYKIVDMDDTTATLTRTDPSGKVSSPTKVRHKLDSIEAGIKTAKRGDENGVVVIKESVVNEISAIDGLTDVIDGKTSSIEGVKLSKDMAEHIMYWVRTSPYGKKYGTWFKRNGIAKLLPIAFMWGLERYLPSNLKGELATLKSKYGKSVNEASDTKKRFMFDFYNDSFQKNTERETNFMATTLDSAIKAAEHMCKVTGYGYVEIYYKDLFLGSMKKKDGFKFVEGRGYRKYILTYELNEIDESVNESFQKGENYGGSSCKGGCFTGKDGLAKIIKISKENPKNTFILKDDNYSGLKPYFIKNGIVALAKTPGNPSYDLDRNKVRNLNIGKDVILLFRVVE